MVPRCAVHSPDASSQGASGYAADARYLQCLPQRSRDVWAPGGWGHAPHAGQGCGQLLKPRAVFASSAPAGPRCQAPQPGLGFPAAGGCGAGCKAGAGDLLPFRRAISRCCGEESTLEDGSQSHVELPQPSRFAGVFQSPGISPYCWARLSSLRMWLLTVQGIRLRPGTQSVLSPVQIRMAVLSGPGTPAAQRLRHGCGTGR